MATFKKGDAVIGWRYNGPPMMDATVQDTGVVVQQTLDGKTSRTPTATLKFADSTVATVAAERLLAGGPFYAVKTPLADTACSSASQIVAAIGAYMQSNQPKPTLAKVTIMFMQPGQKTGVGSPLNPGDFYVSG